MPSGAAIRFTALLVMVVALAVTAVTLGQSVAAIRGQAVEMVGWWAPLVAVMACTALMAALVPRSVVAAAAGLLFGPLWGAGYVLAGAALAAVVAFTTGRWLGRDFVKAHRRLAAVDRWIVRGGPLGVVALRLVPVAPFGLVSYACGTTGLRLGTFIGGTLIGAAPGTALYASLGAAALSPGTPGFVIFAVTAVVLALAGAAVARRHAGGRDLPDPVPPGTASVTRTEPQHR